MHTQFIYTIDPQQSSREFACVDQMDHRFLDPFLEYAKRVQIYAMSAEQLLNDAEEKKKRKRPPNFIWPLSFRFV